MSDLNARCAFLKKWVDEGIPPIFWISGFYFPQAFLTGTLQNFARKNIVSIDSINFSFKVCHCFKAFIVVYQYHFRFLTTFQNNDLKMVAAFGDYL